MRALVIFVLAATAVADPPAWKLDPTDFLHFDRRKIDAKGKLGEPAAITVYAHQIRDGQYSPVSLGHHQMDPFFALRLPGGKSTFKLKLRKVIELRVKGDVREEEGHLVGEFRFASRGKDARGDTHDIRGGVVTTRMVFDRERGLFTSGRIEIKYTLRVLSGVHKPQLYERKFDYKLKAVESGGGKTFRDAVNTAIDKGIARLTALRHVDTGRWKAHGNYDIGTTALVVLTLAACDVPRTDARIQPALAWLFQQTPEKTYDRSVALMAVDRAFTPKSEIAAMHRGKLVKFRRDLTDPQRTWALRIARALEATASGPGTWGYPPAPRVIVRADTSNTQYAVLGLRAAARLGYDAKVSTWLGVLRHFQQHRTKDGKRGEVVLLREGQALAEARPYKVKDSSGYRYTTRSHQGWASMACAAIASLSITRSELARRKSTRLTKSVDREIHQLVLGGWAWLDRNWSVSRHAGHPGNAHLYYYLYSLERAAVLDRVKRVGDRDWYVQGARQLLALQKKEGAWGDDVVTNCFALLFLKRATAPLPITGTR
ncbi:MAG: hypothetical protein OER88_06050 [Planctomycetota bacterium]|nr:hypothetical protein [Planctomycetota bacterium]